MQYTANNLQDCNSNEHFRGGGVSNDVSPDTVAISVCNVTGSSYSNVTACNGFRSYILVTERKQVSVTSMFSK